MRRLRGLTFEKPARFDERFTDVWHATCAPDTVTGERNAELLNWKYDLDDDAPPSEFTILAAVDGDDRVAGYVVYRVKDGVRHVFDLAVLESKRVIDSLLAEFVADARREGAVGLTFLCLGSLGLLGERLRAFRFLPRGEGKRLRVYLPGRRQARGRPAPAGELVLRHGRRRLLAWTGRRRFRLATPPRPGSACCPRRRVASAWPMRGWRRRWRGAAVSSWRTRPTWRSARLAGSRGDAPVAVVPLGRAGWARGSALSRAA